MVAATAAMRVFDARQVHRLRRADLRQSLLQIGRRRKSGRSIFRSALK
jgi:hypothetical protein